MSAYLPQAGVTPRNSVYRAGRCNAQSRPLHNSSLLSYCAIWDYIYNNILIHEIYQNFIV